MIVDMIANTDKRDAWWRFVRRITALGEPLLELQPTADGRIGLAFGGDVANSMVCLARILGTSEKEFSLVTALGNSGYSEWLRDRLTREGIQLCEPPGEGEPGIYGLPLDPGGRPGFSYWRENSAARRFFRAARLKQLDALLGDSQLLVVSGITLALCSRESFEHLCRWVQQHARHSRVVFDCNFRSRLWATIVEARARIERFERLASVVVTGAEDEKSVWGSEEPRNIIERLSRLSAEYVIRAGSKGCWVGFGKISCHVPAAPLRVIGTAGAGDAHLAGYIAARIYGHSRTDAAAYANAVAGTILSERGSAPGPSAQFPALPG